VLTSPDAFVGDPANGLPVFGPALTCIVQDEHGFERGPATMLGRDRMQRYTRRF